MSNAFFLATSEDLRSVLAELRPREPIFHQAALYSSMEDFDNLMTPAYWEVGASGRRYSRAFILQHLAANTPIDAAAAGWTTSDFACGRLGPATYLLTYTLAQGDRLTRRSTIWQRTADSWHILYHQGTIVTASDDDVAPEGEGYQPRT